MSAYSLLLLVEARLARNQDFLPLKTITITTQSPYSPFNRVMEKSVKNAVFKGFPVLMESDTFGSKQGQAAYLPSLFSIDSQLSTKIKTNFQSNFFKGFYLVPKCIKKKITVGLIAWGRLGSVG